MIFFFNFNLDIERRYWLHDVGIQYYNEEQIEKNNIAVWQMGNKVQNLVKIHRETFLYENGRMKNVWEETFRFPNFLSTRDLYTFRYDEEGYISAFSRREFWGDNERSLPWGEHYTPVQKKKKKDTGNNSARWKMPNYFTIK